MKLKKPLLALAGLGIVLIVGFLLVGANKKGSRDRIAGITQEVLTHTKSGQFEKALAHFQYGKEGQPSRSDILTTLALLKESYLKENVPEPKASPENIEVMDNEGQVKVNFTLENETYPVRFDFQKDRKWKIVGISFGGSLNLEENKQAQGEAGEAFSNANYSRSPTTLNLPNGDKIEIKSTLISPEEYYLEYKFLAQKAIYTTAIYEPPYIRSYKEIEIDKYFEGYYKFDIRDIKDKGILLIYPEGTEMKAKKEQVNQSPLLQIPFKVE